MGLQKMLYRKITYNNENYNSSTLVKLVKFGSCFNLATKIYNLFVGLMSNNLIRVWQIVNNVKLQTVSFYIKHYLIIHFTLNFILLQIIVVFFNNFTNMTSCVSSSSDSSGTESNRDPNPDSSAEDMMINFYKITGFYYLAQLLISEPNIDFDSNSDSDSSSSSDSSENIPSSFNADTFIDNFMKLQIDHSTEDADLSTDMDARWLRNMRYVCTELPININKDNLNQLLIQVRQAGEVAHKNEDWELYEYLVALQITIDVSYSIKMEGLENEEHKMLERYEKTLLTFFDKLEYKDSSEKNPIMNTSDSDTDSNVDLLEKYNPTTIFNTYKLYTQHCKNPEEVYQRSMDFMKTGFPEQFLAKTIEELSKPETLINRFQEKAGDEIVLKSLIEIDCFVNFRTAMITYNVSLVRNILEDPEQVKNIFFKTKEYINKQF